MIETMIMSARSWLLTVVASFFVFSTGLALAGTRKASGAPRIFLGPEGRRLTVIALAPPEEARFLIHFEGCGGPWEAKSILHERVRHASGDEYIVSLGKKKRFTSLRSKSTGWSGWTEVTAEAYGTGEALPYAYSEKESKKLDAARVTKLLALEASSR